MSVNIQIIGGDVIVTLNRESSREANEELERVLGNHNKYNVSYENMEDRNNNEAPSEGNKFADENVADINNFNFNL